MKTPTTSCRNSLLALLFIFSYLNSTAQTIFFEDFQNGMPGNFTLYDQDSLIPDAGVSFVTKAWVIRNESTDSIATSTSWYNPAGTADDWMVTPAIVLTSDNILSWEARSQDATWSDGYEIRISTLSNSLADLLANPPLFSIAAENVTWTERFINLGDSGYANQTVYIAFRNNSTDMFLLYIDDIRIGLPAKKDLAVVDLILPANSCDLTSAEEITAMITNYGIDTINNFNISYEIDSKTPITENVSQTILPGATLTYTFTTKADLSTTDSTYTFKAFTSLSGDEDLFNDTLDNYSITHISPQDISTDPLVIGFESTDDLTGWTTIDNNSDGYTWSQTGSAYNGSVSLAYIADINKSTGADDWYFTKCLNLDSAKNYLLSFYYNSYSSEYVKVMLGTDQSIAGMTDTIHNFGELTGTNNTSADSYTQHNSIINISTTGTYYIGLHVYTPDSSYVFLLDDLEIREIPDNDISIIEIVSPLSGCNHTNSESLIIKMQNNGINSVNNFDVTYVLNNSLIITETVTDTLKSLDTLTYNFTSTLDLSVVKDYDIEIYTSLNLDEYKTNDTISSNISNVTHYFQNGALEMGFEPNEDFSGWDVLDNNSDGTSWNSGPYPNNGSTCEIYLGDQVSGADDWLFTKCMNLDTGKLYQLSFYYVPYSNEYLKVMLGTDQTVAGMTDTIHDFDSLAATNALTYSFYSTTIQVDTSGVYYIGFHIYTPSNSYALLLDDIKIKELIPYDLAINAISEPISSCLPGDNESVTIDIINEGTTTINNFQVGFILDGNAPVIEVIPDTLNNLDILSYTFTQTVDLSDLLDHSLTVFSILSNDQNPNNDSLFSTIQYSSHDFSNGPFTMSFEDNEDLSGWLISDVNNDTYTWKIASSPYANSGDQYMGYSYNAADLS
ncbi:choice-of-anchor J domain-containing protein, partial [Cytophagaceae bacterium AH-315-L13]|nr:choice-of-anchor J domain-containing protein [Cytophagaceae bacterium AH-315-L13]